MATTYVHETVGSSGNEAALDRNIAAILLSFHSFHIILLACPIQEQSDKSAMNNERHDGKVLLGFGWRWPV